MLRSSDERVVGLDQCAARCDAPGSVSLPALRERLAGRDAQVEAAELFRLLGDPTRLTVLHALLEARELCVCDLAEVAGVADNVVSQAMRLLRAADVVRTRREGRRIYYRLADAHVRLLLDLSSEHVGHSSSHRADPAPTESPGPPKRTRHGR